METAFMDEKGVGIEREADIYKREKEMTPEEEKRVDILQMERQLTFKIETGVNILR